MCVCVCVCVILPSKSTIRPRNEYVKCTYSSNVQKMFINIYRNPKTRNWFRHITFIHLFEF